MKIAKVAAIAVFALIASDAYAQIEDVHALDFAARSYQYGAVIRSKDQEPVIPVELLKEWGQYCAELSAGLQSDSQSRKSGLPRAICRSVSRYLSDSVLKTVTGRPNDDLGSLTDRQRVVIYGLATLKENLVAAFDTLVESRDVLNVAAESDRSFLRYNYSRAIAYRRDRAFDSFCAELRIRYKTAEHLADFLANNDQVSASKALTEWQDVFRDEEFRFFKWRMEKSGILLDKLLSDIRYFGPGGIASKIRAPCQRTTFSIESEPGSVARKLVVWIDERQRVYGELEFMPTRPRSLSLGATTKSFAYSTYGTVRDDRAILRFKLSASRLLWTYGKNDPITVDYSLSIRKEDNTLHVRNISPLTFIEGAEGESRDLLPCTRNGVEMPNYKVISELGELEESRQCRECKCARRPGSRFCYRCGAQFPQWSIREP